VVEARNNFESREVNEVQLLQSIAGTHIMPTIRPSIAMLGLIVLQACGCGMNREVVDQEEQRPSWEPKIRQVAHTPEVEEVLDKEELEEPGDIRVSYARWMEEIGNVREARQQYELVLQDDPEHLGALLGVAQLDLIAGNLAVAEQMITRAQQVDPQSPEVAFSLGRLRAVQRRWDDAAEAFNDASLGDPGQSAYRFQLAVALTHAGKVDMAMPHFIRTVGAAEAHYNVGRILHDEGLLPQAEEHFALAVEKKPDLEAAHEWLNRTRLSLRENAEGSATAQAEQYPSEGHAIQAVGYTAPAI
jgi:tetratricopeptide (TPR) repeat protein